MEFLVNLIAVLMYSAVHSLLATNAAKDLARKRLGAAADRFYRMVFNILGGLLFLPILLILALRPGDPVYAFPAPWNLIALVIQAGLLILFMIAFLQSQPFSFIGLRQMVGAADAGTLRTTGAYAMVRHPLYSLGLAVLWLLPVMTTGLLGFSMGVTLYILAGSYLEERRLVAEFGDAYRTYQQRVARLIPFLY